jgi:hypothetical protein
MNLRLCIAAAAAMFGLLLGPAIAQANHSFSLSKTEAAAGDEVEFQITSTQAGESYIVRVDDREVASGVDSTGNGVSDKFTMPDLGNSDLAASVEVRITPVNGDPDHFGSQTLQYLAGPSGGSSNPAIVQPAPVPVATTPDPDPTPVISTPNNNNSSKKPSSTKETSSNNTGNNTTGGNNNSNSTKTTPTTTSTPTSTGSGSSSPSTSTRNRSSTSAAAPPASSPPPGPTGPNAPVGATTATTLSPLSGLAEVGKTGFPVLVILLIVLLAAAALTAVGPRLWQRWEPALPWGPSVDDEVRLGALSRASASGAELQQTIAARKVTRSAGRSG